jgi:hypothetical protein
MITVENRGNYKKTEEFLTRALSLDILKKLEKYGEMGVNALSSATPKNTGLTASSWSYEIKNQNDHIELIFNNSNVNKYVNIAIILDQGHATRSGYWVEGRNYIEPAIQPVFDKLAEYVWKEVTG